MTGLLLDLRELYTRTGQTVFTIFCFQKMFKMTKLVPQCFMLPIEHYYSGSFYSCQFIESFRPFHSFWEEEDLSREISASFTKWHHYHIMTIHFQGHPGNRAAAYFKTFMFVFINSISPQFFFCQVPNQYRSLDFQKQDTSQNFHMAWYVILCSIVTPIKCESVSSPQTHTNTNLTG